MPISIRPPIRFNFNLDKFITCVAIFAQHKLKELDKLKVCKLLYYTDKYHLLKYGTPVIGDTYHHLDCGPIPSISLDILNAVICEDRVYDKKSNKEKFEEFLTVNKGIFHHKYPIFELKKAPNLDCLSESEIEVINKVIAKYGNYTPKQLIDSTHEDASWQKTENPDEIDYRLFFENESDVTPGALEYLESLREDLELMIGLNNSD